MDAEVSRTLAELERKLHDLELALTSIGVEQPEQAAPTQAASRDPASLQSPSEPPPSGARVVDESVDLSAGGEGHAGAPGGEQQGHAGTQLGEQAHAGTQGGEQAHAGAPVGEQQGHAGTRAEEHFRRAADESIELVELVRFRDRLESVMRDLVEDYERIIRLRAASEQPRAPIDER